MINNFKNNVLSTIEKMKNTEPMKDMNYLYYSSYLFLIASLYALYNKLYLSGILTFYLFITAMVHWNDYNNKFKLCGDHYMVFIVIIYTIYTCFKVKDYVCIVLLLMLLLSYFISYYYMLNNNYIISSNIWIITHAMISCGLVYLFNKLKIYNTQKLK